MDTQSILSNLIVATLIGTLAMTMGWHGRRAALAHVLWIVFFIKLVTPPIWQIEISVPHQPIFDWDFFWLSKTWTWLGFVWIAGFLYLVFQGVIKYARFARLLQREGRLDPEASAFVASLLASNRSAPPVIRIPVRLSPMLFGSLLSPQIVCPDQLWGLLSNEQRQAFLAHETAHFVRRDHWVRWLEWIVTSIYWWFPGVYFGRGQLERHEEACCDAWAVNHLRTTPRAYAETLLSVVDFVSEQEASIPRLANGMQPTYTLEERLRLLMRPNSNASSSKTVACFAISVCVGLWGLHPILEIGPYVERMPLVSTQPDAFESNESLLVNSNPVQEAHFSWPSDDLLPEVPQGFWNWRADGKWADFTLQLTKAQVTAEAGKGISITTSQGTTLYFSMDDLTAMAEITSTGRLVIGDMQGRLRLWDLQAGIAVSLIGKHNAAITSLTYHESYGLVSGDDLGQIVRWDLDSGLMLASLSIHAPVQSIRCSADGEQLAIMTGSWRDCDKASTVSVHDSLSLEHRGSFVQPHSAATLIELSVGSNPLNLIFGAKQWHTVDWQGQLRSIDGTDGVWGQIDKDMVSSLVFAQQSVSSKQIAPPPLIPPNALEPSEFVYVEQ